MNNYEKAIEILLSYYEGFNYTREYIDENSEVFVIEDSLLFYVEYSDNSGKYLMSEGYKYLYIQELSYNNILKFNRTKYEKDIESLKILVDYVRFQGLNSYSYTEQKELFEKIDKIKPELKLTERYEQWSGESYNVVFLQMNSIDNKKEYAVYVTTKKPSSAVQKIAKELQTRTKMEIVNNGFSVETNFFYMKGRYCRNFDFIDAYYSHKHVRHKNKLEENLKYYYITAFYKGWHDMRRLCPQLLDDLYNGVYNETEWTSYIYPTKKWKTEEIITKTIAKHYKEYGVISQHRPLWLKSSLGGQMSYDIYISELKVAIEYQGEQHFKPIDYFGGEESFKKVQIRDKEKQMLSKERSIKLIYINYWEEVTESLIIEKIEKAIKEQ